MKTVRCMEMRFERRMQRKAYVAQQNRQWWRSNSERNATQQSSIEI